MAERPSSFDAHSTAELDRALSDLAGHLAWPETPDLAGGARARTEQEPGARRFSLVAWPGRRAWLAAAALVMLLLAFLALFPEARTAIADRLGLPGVVIRWVDEPLPAPSPVGTRLLLGRAVTLEEARGAVGYEVHVPTQEEFAEPPEVYLLGRGEDAMVSFVYPPRPDLPEDEISGVGALMSQFPGETSEAFIGKGLGGGEGTAAPVLENVLVNGREGYWISGAHGVYLACTDDRNCREERYRLAGNVLLWVQDGMTFRLESALSREEALAVAESVRVVE